MNAELLSLLLCIKLKVHCARPETASFVELDQRFKTMAVGSNSDPYEPAQYQVFLWLSIGLAFVVYGAVYSIVYMDNKKDTLLYSKFNAQVGRKS